MKTFSPATLSTEQEESICYPIYPTKKNEKGEPHCVDGPACEGMDKDGNPYKRWFQNGLRHRTDGPAEEFSNFEHWFIRGEKLLSDDKKGNLIGYGRGAEIKQLPNETASEMFLRILMTLPFAN